MNTNNIFQFTLKLLFILCISHQAPRAADPLYKYQITKVTNDIHLLQPELSDLR
jgi:hypothetical protein